MEFPALEASGVFPVLSEVGKRVFLPQGIFYWTGRATEEADINATIGAATGRHSHVKDGASDDNVVLHIPSFAECFPSLKPNEIFGYAKVLGIPAFRSGWKNYLLSKAGDRAAAIKDLVTLPVVTPGVTGGLHFVTRLFLDPDEPLITADFHWGNYDNIAVRNFGGKVQTYSLYKDNRLDMDSMAEAIRGALKDHNKAFIMLNFPNNPSGYMPTVEEGKEILDTLRKVADETDKWIVVVTDDAYEGYVYEDGLYEGSLFYDLVGLHPRIFPVKLDGITKEMLWYGGRVGAITFGLHQDNMKSVAKEEVEKELMDKMGGLIRSTVSNCPHPQQVLIARALAEPDTFMKERQRTIDVLGKRYHALQKEIEKHKDSDLLQWMPFNSGFFAFANHPKPMEMAEHLLKKYRVGIIPIKNANVSGIRVAFCSVEEELVPKMTDALYAAAEDLK